MSNTNFIAINGNDLIHVFRPKISGINNTTHYLASGVDLSNIFQPYDGTSQKARLTGFTVNNVDLNSIFQNIVDVVVTNYNPFSANTTPTGYTYYFFSISESLTIASTINNVNMILIGGGGGGGTGFGWNGGGAGGVVNTYSGLTLLAGTYTITIGAGGTSGQVNVVSNGQNGGTTSITGPGGFNYSAAGGGGGGGANLNVTGAGGSNGTIYGNGGDHNTTYTNVQPGSGVYTGDGQNGYLYTFLDGTSTTYNFGGGGGGGGRNCASGPIPNTYLGGGGIVGTRNATTFTNITGGCGGNGYFGITNGDPGFNFSFNGKYYNVGGGAGAGGNSDAFYCLPGGKGCDGIVIVYF
jgi:hypothetical protein